MNEHPLAAWRFTALPYADPQHDPEWHPADRPQWPGEARSLAFRSWVLARLYELEGHTLNVLRQRIAHHFDTEHPTLEQALSKAFELLPPEVQGQWLAEFRIAARSESDPVKIVLATLRFDEPLRRGPTATPEQRYVEPKGLAAWDIWSMRKIILPRFWPDNAVGEFKLGKGELAKIAAQRRKCTPKEAQRAYQDFRLASK